MMIQTIRLCAVFYADERALAIYYRESRKGMAVARMWLETAIALYTAQRKKVQHG